MKGKKKGGEGNKKGKLIFRMSHWITEGYRFYHEIQKKTALKINQRTGDQ